LRSRRRSRVAAEDDHETAEPDVLHACMMPSGTRRLGTELHCLIAVARACAGVI